MTNTSPSDKQGTVYIETPRVPCRPEKISAVLEKRMKQFLLERRRRQWQEKGE